MCRPRGGDDSDSDDEDNSRSRRRGRLDSLMRGLAEVGTTAEVLSMSNESDDEAIALPTVKAITRGRQRFKLLDLTTQSAGDVVTLSRCQCSQYVDGNVVKLYFVSNTP